MPQGMAGFKQAVPPLHLRVVQADFPEHDDPLAGVYLVLHMFISVAFVSRFYVLS